MHKSFAFLLALFVFGFPFAARAQKTTMYRLGQVYASDQDADIKCLESHSGFILEHKECRAKGANKCASDAECQEQNGGSKFYYCSKKTKTCQYQECYKTAFGGGAIGGYDICSSMYSHMRSCVDNENGDGGHYCKVTCTWDTTSANLGLTQEELSYKMMRMRADVALWKKPSTALSYFSALNYDKSDPYSNAWDLNGSFYRTCQYGKPVQCGFKSLLQLTAKESPADYPCMTCDIATGGSYGIDGNENVTGTHPYAARFSVTKGWQRYGSGNDAWYKPEGSASGEFNITVNGCAFMQYGATSTNAGQNIIGFHTGGGDVIPNGVQILKNFKTVAELGTVDIGPNSYVTQEPTEVYFLGNSPLCSFFHRANRFQLSVRSFNTYVAGGGYNTEQLIYLPRQDVKTKIHTGDYEVGDSLHIEYDKWTKELDLSTGPHLLCCSDQYYSPALQPAAGMSCVDLSTDKYVVDLE